MRSERGPSASPRRGVGHNRLSILHFLIAWPNAPFTVAGGIACIFALLQATGLLGLLAGGGEGDADHDVDTDMDHDVDADADHDVDQDHDADHDADNEQGVSAAILGTLGFGKLPFGLIWQSYAIAFAITGLALNAHYANTGVVPMLSLAWTVPAGLASGYALVAVLAKLLGPVFSSKAEEATSRAQLVGSIGVVISSTVSAEFGEIRVKDKSGHDLRVVCKLAPGSHAPKEHESVVIVELDDKDGLLVAPLEDHEDRPRRRVDKGKAKAPADEPDDDDQDKQVKTAS